jgi:hypothetical protein
MDEGMMASVNCRLPIADFGLNKIRQKSKIENLKVFVFQFYGQATKSIRWMPWCQEAMKDVVSCDKPRGAAKQA